MGSPEKGFQESSDTHLLEALQAYLIHIWQQQGGLCYPWRFSSALHGSRSVILFLAISSCSFEPLDLLGCSLHLVHGDTKPRNLGSPWGAPCPLDAHARVAGTESHAPAARVCLQVSAGEPCMGFLSREPGLDYIHGRVGVVCPRWHLTGVTKDALSDHVWS